MSVLPTWATDDPVSRTYPLYARAQIYRSVVTPLTGTSMFATNDVQWRQALLDLAVFEPAEFDFSQREMSVTFGGYCYTNLSIARVVGARTPGLSARFMDLMFCGTPMAPADDGVVRENPGAEAALARTLDDVLALESLPQLDADRECVERLVAQRPDVGACADGDLLARWNRAVDGYGALNHSHLWVSTLSVVLVASIAHICEHELGDASLPTRLFGGIGDVESAAPSIALWELGRTVRASAEASAVFDAGLDDLEPRLGESADGELVLAGLADFVARYGSRGHTEWEIASPTFETVPSFLHSSLDRIRQAPDEHSPLTRGRGSEGAREALVAETLLTLRSRDPEIADRFRLLLAAAELFVRGRERTKTTIIRQLHEGRLVALELGRRAVERGVFARREDATLLLHDELDDFLARPTPYADVVRDRSNRYDALSALEPPPSVFGAMPALESWPRRDAGTAGSLEIGESITGIAGNAGRVVGRARVVLDPLEPRGLAPGEILVAPETDPGWLPLFVAAAGVVVDTGSQVSHAIVVSRELGMPCVIRAAHATKRIPDGMLIEVDGTNGRVTAVAST